MTAAIAEILGLAFIPAFLLLDLMVRHRRYEAPRFWRIRALAVSAAILALSIATTLAWGHILQGFSLVDGSRLGTWGGALAGILLYELVHYFYHRAAHRFDLLWRGAHQMHHSAESLDAFGAYFGHPVDFILFTSWSVVTFYPVLGLTPEAGAVAGAFLAFNAMFQHANIRTPRWLGYIIQRPESHSLHHARGVHRYNYSDLPLWDMVFGTFRNPAAMQPEVGFYNGASSRLLPMLLGRDVSRRPSGGRAGKDQGTFRATLKRRPSRGGVTAAAS